MLEPLSGSAAHSIGQRVSHAKPHSRRHRQSAGHYVARTQEQAPFRKLQDVMKVDDIVSWLRHGESKHKDNGKNKFRETTTISEFEVLVV
jgi:hypothetical protein